MNKLFLKVSIKALFLLLFSINLTAQDIKLNDSLPVNKKIKKGVLSNGLTYYLYKTDVTKNVASYYIIQNVGSVLENDDQQGLAHFLEHMAFNGTENFEGKGILNTLQKHGAVFGKDINAITSFDETIYNLNNIATTDELIDTSLLILHDWTNHLLLTEEEIDAERGVIKEEWRTRQSGRMRIYKQTLPTLFNESLYASRMPIGLMDIVENFDYKALRDFYHDWYRTDLQAIAVVGDFDIDEMESKIKNLFSDIPAVEDPIERFVVEIPDNDEMLYALAMDDEVTTSNISFGINHPKSLEDQTVNDLKESLLKAMATGMLNARLQEEIQKPDATFLGAYIGYGKLALAKNKFSVTIAPKKNQQYKAFQDVIILINKALKFGFTQGEIDRIKKQFSNSYENKIKSIDDISHPAIITTIKKNYLENETMMGVDQEYELVKPMLATVTANEINEALKKLYTEENRVLTVTGVKENNNLTKEDAIAILNEVENSTELIAYSDAFSGKTLLGDLYLEEGEIVAESWNENIQATTFTLGNGIKVHYKFADKNKNNVRLNAISYGGLSLVEDDNLPSANLVGNVVQLSGLGDYSPTDLTKILVGKTASTNINISNLAEVVSGTAVTKDVETLLQMTYLRFVKPRFDKDAYEVLMGNVDDYIIRRSNTINEKMKDSVTVTLYGHNNPKHRLFNEDYAKEFSFEKVKAVYLDRFNNAADFEFFIVGDIQEAELKSLLEKYIASIPTNNTTEIWKDNSEPWIGDAIDKDIYLKMEDPKSSVRIVYKNNIEYSIKNMFVSKAFGDILQLRYTETLREQEGGTYGARARASISKRPFEQASISVMFDCDPDKVDKLISIVHEEIQKIANGDINQEDLDKTTTNYLSERKKQQDYNNYDMSLLINYYREGYNMNAPENFENIIHSLKPKDIEEYANTLLENSKTYEIVFKPLK